MCSPPTDLLKCKWNSFSYERFCRETRFETEAQTNSEIDILFCIHVPYEENKPRRNSQVKFSLNQWSYNNVRNYNHTNTAEPKISVTRLQLQKLNLFQMLVYILHALVYHEFSAWFLRSWIPKCERHIFLYISIVLLSLTIHFKGFQYSKWCQLRFYLLTVRTTVLDFELNAGGRFPPLRKAGSFSKTSEKSDREGRKTPAYLSLYASFYSPVFCFIKKSPRVERNSNCATKYFMVRFRYL